MEINKNMKSNFLKISILLLISLLVSLTFNEEGVFLQLNKKQFKKDEIITGKAYINPAEMKAILNIKDAGYCAYNNEYELKHNAIQLRVAPANKDTYSYDGFVTITNAITIKNDTAFLSFKVPQSLIKKDNIQVMQIKVARMWQIRGKDTTIVMTKQFQISK